MPAGLVQVVFGLALVAWAWAGLRAGSLAGSETPRDLQRAGDRLLVGLAAGAVTVAGLVVLAGGSARTVGAGLPIVALTALAAVAVAVPRLVAVRRAARMFNGIGVMSPALRQQAAHPLLAWPLQATAFAAVGAEILLYVESSRAPLAVFTGVALATAISWHRMVRRHRRLGGAVVVAWKGTLLTPHVKKVPLQTIRR